MESGEWRLHGSAYGRTFDAKLTFVSKEYVPMPADLVEAHLRNAGKTGDLAYRALVETQEQGKFRTDTGEEVIVTPRYVGSRLGNSDDHEGNTICGLSVNGEYVALALYSEERQEIVACEY